MNKEKLINFEKWCISEYKKGNIRSPVHLSGGNEDQLIEIFKDIKPQDWVFTTYRSHYHALLKGVPEDRLKQWILDNKSIHFMDKEYKVFSSAIVGGCLPIALGVAMAIKRKEKEGLDSQYKNAPDNVLIVENNWEENHPHVYIFVGDMTASLGTFQDCLKYAYNFDLPITFIVEDNGMSTDTITKEAWGEKDLLCKDYTTKTKYYKYKRVYPHYGTGERINFT